MRFIRLAVPALIACLPQTTFYAINNDILTPLTFGAAFVLRAENLGRARALAAPRRRDRAGACGRVSDQDQQPPVAGRRRRLARE